MFENFWHKKEKPLQGLMGLGGGSASPLVGGAAPIDASGGNIVGAEPGNGYKYHVFTSAGAFTVNSGAGDVEYLVVAGGGGGYGGGGGDGGYRSSITGESTGGGGSLESALPISTSPGSYTVTIGAGGKGAAVGG